MLIIPATGNGISLALRRWRQLSGTASALLLCLSLANCQAQQPSPAGLGAWTTAQMQKEAEALVAKAAQSPGGIATEVMDKYPGSTVLLSVRVRSGRAELHAIQSDYMFILDGEGSLLVGGKMIGAYQTAPNESRGVKLEGASATSLSKGSFIHVPPDTPHQTLVAPGSKLVYLVVKVTKQDG